MKSAGKSIDFDDEEKNLIKISSYSLHFIAMPHISSFDSNFKL